MNEKTRTITLNVVLLVLGTTAGLAFCEALARVFLEPPLNYALYSREKTVAHSSLQTVISDPRLLVRVPPNAPGHDERGFRNPSILDSADVVAIGDSQTWGVNVPQSDTWPAILAGLGNMRVYSMSVGGWGPIQYEILAGDALVLNPKALLIAVYLGNDIFDSCSHAYGTDLYAKYRWADEQYASALSELRASLKAVEYHARVADVQLHLAKLGGVAKIWQALARRSLIVQILMTRGFLPAVPSVDELYQIADEAWAQGHPDAASIYDAGTYSTVLTFGYRGIAVDLENACIRDGMRITKEILGSLKALSSRAGVQIGIVFIPTKEFIYATADSALRARMSRNYTDLVKNERVIKLELLDHCKQLKIVCVDATTWLVEAAEKRVVLYRPDSDGHPIREGYQQIAFAAHKALEAMGVLTR